MIKLYHCQPVVQKQQNPGFETESLLKPKFQGVVYGFCSQTSEVICIDANVTGPYLAFVMALDQNSAFYIPCPEAKASFWFRIFVTRTAGLSPYTQPSHLLLFLCTVSC